MRLIAVSILAVAICAPPAIAAPSLRVKATLVGDAYSTATEIEARVTGGCGDSYCAQFRLDYAKNGVVVINDPFGFDRFTGRLGAADFDWNCSRHGHWEARITYTDAAYNADGTVYDGADDNPTPFLLHATKAFTIRRCRPRKKRYVSNSVASATANRDNENAYPSEFVSRIRCSPVGDMRGSLATRWRCATAHNNNYRECVDTDTYSFLRTDQFGFAGNNWRRSTGYSRRCHNL